MFKLANKLFSRIEDDSKFFVSINKAWCKRFVEKMKAEVSKDKTVVDSRTTISESIKDKTSETFYEMFSEPESHGMEHNIANSSELWREHTINLLEDKIQTKGWKKASRQERKEQELWVVNKSMMKALGNKHQEIEKIEDEIMKKQFKTRFSRNVRR